MSHESAAPIERLDVSVYVIPTDAPEADGTAEWSSTTMVLVRAQARTRRGGVQMEHAPAAVWTLDHGVIVRIELYLERSQALAAAGLEVREPPRDEA